MNTTFFISEQPALEPRPSFPSGDRPTYASDEGQS